MGMYQKPSVPGEEQLFCRTDVSLVHHLRALLCRSGGGPDAGVGELCSMAVVLQDDAAPSSQVQGEPAWRVHVQRLLPM